jgi:hypothetical protein
MSGGAHDSDALPPARSPRPHVPQISRWAGSTVEASAEDVRWVRRNFSTIARTGTGGQESGWVRNAVAARRAARAGIGTQYNARYAG